jgi:hypothetical protein
MSAVIERRNWIAAALALPAGFATLSRWPFPTDNALLRVVLWEDPSLWRLIRDAYVVMCFTTPFIVLSMVASVIYIFVVRFKAPDGSAPLPPYPDAGGRTNPALTIGEIHHARRAEPAVRPSWLTIPERGLYTGIAVFGAIGSGKTSGCMYPFAEQLLAYRAQDKARRIGGLVLEVKGDFCHKVRSILDRHDRAVDYLEVSLGTEYRYNPLYNDLDAYALAFGIASLLNNLYGKGRELFWQQAYTNLVKVHHSSSQGSLRLRHAL